MTVTVWKLLSSTSQNQHVHADLLEVCPETPPTSLDTASAQLPAGAYTTFRTYQRCQALRLDDHFTRLEQTAALAGTPVLLNRPSLRSALRMLAHCVPSGKAQRFRITVDLENQPGQIYIAADLLQVPSKSVYARGARAILCDLQRRLPEAKLTRFIERAGEVRRNLPRQVNEAIMVDPEGYLREGLSSNFFAVRDGQVWTASQGVLAGITRATVLDCAAKLGQPVRLDAIHKNDLAKLDEVFITSASRGVLPLRRIDACTPLLSVPGPLTLRLMQAFDHAIASEIEPI